jgi:betaine-aldehyde dehydrogenase
LINPSTGELFCEMPISDGTDVDAALQVAAKAFVSWRLHPVAAQRGAVLLKIPDVMEAHAEELVALEAENCGRIISVTMENEIPHGEIKNSAYGKDLLVYGFEDYTRVKHVMHNIES